MVKPTVGRGILRSALLGLLVAALAVLVNGTELFRAFELRTVDLRFRLRGPRPVETPLAVVFIGEDSIAAYGRWPWSWDYHALLIDALQRAGARLVLFDILFAEAPSSSDAQMLAAAARKAGNVQFISSFARLVPPGAPEDDTLITGSALTEPLAAVGAAAAGVGHANAIRDADGGTRRIPLVVRRSGALYPAAALRAACAVLGVPWDSVRVTARGDLELRPPGRPPVLIPVDADGMTPVDFAGGLEAFPVQFSYRQVLEADAHPGAGAIDLSLLKDRVVIVGVTFAGNADLQPTPFSTTYPMFLIQATMVDNILRGEFPRRPPAWVALVVCLLLGAALGVLTFSFRPVASLALTALAGGAYAACAVVAFTRAGWLVPLVAPLTAILAAYVLVTTAQYVEVRAEKVRVFERLKYLGHLVESAAEAIFSFDRSGTIDSWNGGAVRLFGWTKQEALGRRWSFLLTDGARGPVDAALALLCSGGEPKSFEINLVAKDGRAIPVEIAFSVIRDSAGTVVGTSAISLDLTEKKRMIAALIQSEKLAEIGRMGSGIVHEIKNPLTSIMMMSDGIVATRDLPAKTLKYADIIQKEAQRILRLSQNILSFARPRKPEMKATDVNHVLEDTLGLVEYELKKGRISAHRNFDAAAPAVWGDGEKLKQVFLNLIVNATHASPEGGKLEVRTCGLESAVPPLPAGGAGWPHAQVGEPPDGPCVVVQIADRGSGIPPEMLPKIFDPFFSTKEEGQGTGLGLYISRNIVLEHKGSIAVASAIGGGTVFTISLPTAAAPEGVPAGTLRHSGENRSLGD
ncbi:MAG: CHASE2 domain-containing protein [Candidatus Methylomirabilia bacterium]